MKLRKPLNLTVNQRVSGSSPEGGAQRDYSTSLNNCKKSQTHVRSAFREFFIFWILVQTR